MKILQKLRNKQIKINEASYLRMIFVLNVFYIMEDKYTILDVKARQIYDSRGFPTL